ncbi:hypothetical protein [Burkholderia pseudomallei]|uniref:hypothetical protein n=1 Tax=Burkholderia pseudomallei TaxID=28450 RepID=UPI001FBA836F|nr:hypothetical protein [Burkholderia pseudomallei]
MLILLTPIDTHHEFAGLFGAYGDEGVEDVHLVSSLLASLIVAVAVVCGANRLFRRPSRGN